MGLLGKPTILGNTYMLVSGIAKNSIQPLKKTMFNVKL